jgi:DNA repair protein RecN (Recombination protein N)
VLQTLTVSNFALIEHASIDFAAGLNILTGETGAGKSIIVDALNTVLGGRASGEMIRSGCDYFRVEAVFDIEQNSNLREFLADQGIPVEAESLIINRYVTRQGRNSIAVNGCNVTVGVLRQIGDQLVDMHGQHENQTLLKPETHLALVDSLDGAIKDKLDAYRGLYNEWTKLCTELAGTETDSRERAQRLDMLEWQTKEIAAAALKAGEEEELEQTISLLTNAEKIAEAVGKAYLLFNEGSRGNGGVLSALSEIKRELESAARYDANLSTALVTITDALYQLEEAAGDLRNYNDNFEYEPQRLAQMQDRMDVIHKAKKKYGATVDEVLSYYEKAVAELSAISNHEERLAELEAKKAAAEKQLSQAADELDELRRKAASRVSKEICRHLADLGMPKAILDIAVNKSSKFNAAGRNEVAMLFSANPGEAAKPLQKVASGGELSRIALAMKTVCLGRESVGTMVFDEVDSGVGGQTGQMVGEKIALVSRGKQVLCITHLPQIAAMADCHLYVEKKIVGERTTTAVKLLNPEEHLVEVTRMISGDNVTKTALDNAAEMIAAAQQKKSKMVK